MQKNPAIGHIENGDTHQAIEPVGDVSDAGLELFPKQIAAAVARSGLGFLLTESIRRQYKGNECSQPHVPIFAAAHSLSRARFWNAATRCLYGTIANTRAGKPDPPFGLGKLTTPSAPASGT